MAVPGREIAQVLGLVSANSVMSRNVFSDLGSQLKSAVGGRLGGGEAAVGTAMNEASSRLMEEARRLGADAVVGVSVAMSSVAVSGSSGSAELVLMSATAVACTPAAAPDW